MLVKKSVFKNTDGKYKVAVYNENGDFVAMSTLSYDSVLEANQNHNLPDDNELGTLVEMEEESDINTTSVREGGLVDVEENVDTPSSPVEHAGQIY